MHIFPFGLSGFDFLLLNSVHFKVKAELNIYVSETRQFKEQTLKG